MSISRALPDARQRAVPRAGCNQSRHLRRDGRLGDSAGISRKPLKHGQVGRRLHTRHVA
jgi:hypothetical protein